MYGDTHIRGIHISLGTCAWGYTYHGDTHITRDMCMGIHISRGYTYHGDTHITRDMCMGIHISRGYTYPVTATPSGIVRSVSVIIVTGVIKPPIFACGLFSIPHSSLSVAPSEMFYFSRNLNKNVFSSFA